MKKVLAVFLMFLFLTSSSAYAATENIAEGMATKAIRGAVNLVTGIVEVPMQIYKGYTNGFGPIENKIGSKTVGTILGFFRGFGHAGGRIGWGGLELFAFWSANPPDNDGIGIRFDAEYAWEMGEPYSLFEPSLSEGVKPMGRKFVRGLGDAFLGIAELPGQTIKGYRNGETLTGIGKGFWFWFSRQAYGFGSIFTALVPNPADNPGYPFDNQYAWSALSVETVEE